MLLGNQWGVWSYFHVDAMMQPKEMVSLYLCNMSNKVIKMEFGFSVNHGNNGKQVAYKQSATPEHIGPVGTDSGARGFPNFAKRVESY